MLFKLVVTVVLMFLLSLAPVTVLADGVNKKKKPRKKPIVSVRAVAKPAIPVVEIYPDFDNNQVIVNVYFAAFLSTSMTQSGNTVVAISAPKDLAQPFETSKDKQIAEKFISELKTSSAVFITSPAHKSKSEVGTLAFQKKDWTEQDLEKLSQLIEASFAPTQVAFRPTVRQYNTKPMLFPGQALGQVQN